MDIISLSVTKLANLIANKTLSAVDLTQAYINQIEDVNPKINSVVYYNPERALEDAKKLDQQQAKGKPLGSLHGIPFTVKDKYATQDDPFTFGCLGLKNNIANSTATIVQRLKNAGAIFLGKSNTPEFEGSAETDNLVYGRTANPYNLNYTPGGSSGGSAATVAACCSAFDIGADTGGSLRIPAHYTGIATLRATPGRIPSTGVLGGFGTGPGALFNTEGPLTRYVEDLELIAQVLYGADYVDPNAKVAPQHSMRDVQINHLKLAYFDHDGVCEPAPSIKKAVADAAMALKAAGAQVENSIPKNIGDGFRIYQEILANFAIQSFENAFKQYQVTQRSPLIVKSINNLSQYKCDDVATYLQRWDRWDRFRSDILHFFNTYDAFICPITANEPFLHGTSMWDPENVNNISYSWSTSATLLPAVAVRAGTASSGLPVGVQIVAKPYREDIALMAAKQIELAVGGWQEPKFVI